MTAKTHVRANESGRNGADMKVYYYVHNTHNNECGYKNNIIHILPPSFYELRSCYVRKHVCM